jgi:hypothetical protein
MSKTVKFGQFLIIGFGVKKVWATILAKSQSCFGKFLKEIFGHPVQ